MILSEENINRIYYGSWNVALRMISNHSIDLILTSIAAPISQNPKGIYPYFEEKLKKNGKIIIEIRPCNIEKYKDATSFINHRIIIYNTKTTGKLYYLISSESKIKNNEYHCELIYDDIKSGRVKSMPVDIYKILIQNNSDVGDIVLDPFIGTGTTAIACIECDRQYIGIEKELGIYRRCVRRIEKCKERKELK